MHRHFICPNNVCENIFSFFVSQTTKNNTFFLHLHVISTLDYFVFLLGLKNYYPLNNAINRRHAFRRHACVRENTPVKNLQFCVA